MVRKGKATDYSRENQLSAELLKMDFFPKETNQMTEGPNPSGGNFPQYHKLTIYSPSVFILLFLCIWKGPQQVKKIKLSYMLREELVKF